jgi:exosortase
VFGLELLGYLVAREGNVLRLSDQNTIAVAEACSGLRMLTAFVIVGAALAFVIRRPAWQKVIVVLSTVPVAILANTLRLMVTALVYEHVGSDVGERLFHDFAGLTMIPCAFVILLVELRLLRWLSTTGESELQPSIPVRA